MNQREKFLVKFIDAYAYVVKLWVTTWNSTAAYKAGVSGYFFFFYDFKQAFIAYVNREVNIPDRVESKVISLLV